MVLYNLNLASVGREFAISDPRCKAEFMAYSGVAYIKCETGQLFANNSVNRLVTCRLYLVLCPGLMTKILYIRAFAKNLQLNS